MDDPFVEVTRGTISAESYASAVYDTRNLTFLEFTAFHEKIAASFSYEAVTDCLLSTNSWIIHKPSIELWFLVEKFQLKCLWFDLNLASCHQRNILGATYQLFVLGTIPSMRGTTEIVTWAARSVAAMPTPESRRRLNSNSIGAKCRPPSNWKKRRQKRPNNSWKARTGPECLAERQLRGNRTSRGSASFHRSFPRSRGHKKKRQTRLCASSWSFIYLFIYLLSSPDSWNGRGPLQSNWLRTQKQDPSTWLCSYPSECFFYFF